MNISGTFKANIRPQEFSVAGEDGVQLARMALDKTFVKAHSQGEMLSAVTGIAESAGYVAIEQVIGSLSGKTGSFVLQHYGIMNQGRSHLTLTVVPDSGCGELQGLNGQMAIRVEDGQHFYDFGYELG